ncbi:unnamed protein product [Protopolystoma xenopodis]|uniref:Uncharacterized protein n=1 Tax=Protopolystoma xenopodis TaxID=117903 RepID=A0A448XNN9_9PLAT|nr:unnamed protein product [Protopolystoma xenopodis]
MHMLLSRNDRPQVICYLIVLSASLLTYLISSCMDPGFLTYQTSANFRLRCGRLANSDDEELVEAAGSKPKPSFNRYSTSKWWPLLRPSSVVAINKSSHSHIPSTFKDPSSTHSNNTSYRHFRLRDSSDTSKVIDDPRRTEVQASRQSRLSTRIREGLGKY